MDVILRVFKPVNVQNIRRYCIWNIACSFVFLLASNKTFFLVKAKLFTLYVDLIIIYTGTGL